MQEVSIVIILGIHLQNQQYIFSTYQESFSVVLSNPCFSSIINQNLLIVCLVILSVVLRLNTLEFFLEELICSNFGGSLCKSDVHEVIISLHQEVFSVSISQLDHSKLTEDLCINYSKLIINSLVKHHVVHEGIYLLTDSTKSVNTVNVNMI